MSVVLLVGRDEMLLRTRAEVLRKTGAEIVWAYPESALAVQADRECDVVVLCHSLPQEVSDVLSETIHRLWPKTRILLVSSARAWEMPDANAAVDGVSSSEPDRLILSTRELLHWGDRPCEGAIAPGAVMVH